MLHNQSGSKNDWFYFLAIQNLALVVRVGDPNLAQLAQDGMQQSLQATFCANDRIASFVIDNACIIQDIEPNRDLSTPEADRAPFIDFTIVLTTTPTSVSEVAVALNFAIQSSQFTPIAISGKYNSQLY